MTVETQGADAPTFVTETTPSGIEVEYTWAPKRKYRLRGLKFLYESDWIEVPSVTTVLEVLDKPALPFWGMKVGIEGVLQLFSLGVLRDYGVEGFAKALIANVNGTDVVVGVQETVDLLTQHKLTVNHQRDKAGARGQSVHDALELWAKDRTIPDPEMFPEEEQGYVRGLVEFFNDVPSAEPIAAEVMVGSIQHGFAGRYDLRIKTTKEHNVVYKRTPVKGAHYATLEPGLLLTDLKTSKGIYPSHSRQLEAYEAASIECGYEPTQARGIIHVTADGHYEFSRSIAELDDFLAVLEVWRSNERMKKRKR